MIIAKLTLHLSLKNSIELDLIKNFLDKNNIEHWSYSLTENDTNTLFECVFTKEHNSKEEATEWLDPLTERFEDFDPIVDLMNLDECKEAVNHHNRKVILTNELQGVFLALKDRHKDDAKMIELIMNTFPTQWQVK